MISGLMGWSNHWTKTGRVAVNTGQAGGVLL